MRRPYESARQLERLLGARRGRQRFRAVRRELQRHGAPAGKGETAGPGQYGESRSSCPALCPALTVSSKSDTRSSRSLRRNARQKFRELQRAYTRGIFRKR